MPETDTVEVYKESDTHVPVATEQIGTLDTSGTAGAAHGKLEEVTPIFAVADAQNALIARDALDPDKPDVPSYLVTMPVTQLTEPLDKDAIKERVDGAAKKAEENPVALGSGPTPAQVKAAEETKPEGGTAPGTTTGTAKVETTSTPSEPTSPVAPQRPATTARPR